MWWHGICTAYGSLGKGSQSISIYCVRTKPFHTFWKLSRPCMYQIDHIVAPQTSRLPRWAPKPFCCGLRPWKLAWHLANLLPSVRLKIVLKRKSNARSWSEAGHKTTWEWCLECVVKCQCCPDFSLSSIYLRAISLSMSWVFALDGMIEFDREHPAVTVRFSTKENMKRWLQN